MVDEGVAFKTTESTPTNIIRSVQHLDSSQKMGEVGAFINAMEAELDNLNSRKRASKDVKEKQPSSNVMQHAQEIKSRDTLNDLRFQAAVADTMKGMQTSVIEGHPFNPEIIGGYVHQHGYTFIIASTVKQEVNIASGQSKKELYVEYLSGKFNPAESKKSGVRDGYGNGIEVEVDFLDEKNVRTNIQGNFGGFTDPYADRVVVIRNNNPETFAKRLEQDLNSMGEERRLLNFNNVSQEEISSYAKAKNPSNPEAVMSQITLLKVASDAYFSKEGESPEQRLARIRDDSERMVQYHVVHHKVFEKVISSNKGGTSQMIGDLTVVQTVRSADDDRAADLFASIKEPAITLTGNLDRYQRLKSQDPEVLKEEYSSHVEASRQLIEDFVKYVEEHKEQFPNVTKSGILALGELSQEQVSKIGRELLREYYLKRGYSFDSELQVF